MKVIKRRPSPVSTTSTGGPRKRPDAELFARMGVTGGQGQKINALAHRLEELVSLAPGLTPKQISKLRAGITDALSHLGSVDTLEPVAPSGTDIRVFGVDPKAAGRACGALLAKDRGRDLPWCTCLNIGGYAFDVQIGVYLHGVAECWKPSKLYYEAALRAGILGELPLRGTE